METDFTVDYMTGMGFAVLAFFVAYGSAAMFKAFRLPADA
jgi:hypothetical protein